MIADQLAKSEIGQVQFSHVQKLMAYASELMLNADGDKAKIEDAKNVFFDAMRLIQFNLTPLIPFFYPKYIRGEPLSFLRRPYAWDMFGMNFHGIDVFRTARQIAKSTIICTREDIRLHLWSGYKTILLTPYPDQIKTLADRFKEVAESNRIRAERVKVKGQNLRENLYYREYGRLSAVKLGYALTSNDATRGNSASTLIIDEAQNFDPGLLDAIDYVLDASPMPSRLFAGSSLTMDTLLEVKFQESSQGSFHIKCTNCPTWINTGEVEECHSIIKPEGPTCPRCKAILTVDHGEMVHKYPDRYDLGFRGIHVPKLIIPEQAESVPKWNKIYRDFISGDLIKFNQEALGIAQSDGAREITTDDLKKICVLKRSDAQAKAMKRHYQIIVSGCDWGGSDYNAATRTKVSFTAHVMMGRNTDGSWDIFHMKKYSGQKYDDIIADILHYHSLFRGNYIITDRGGGDLYNNLIRTSGKIPYHTHWAVNYTAPNTSFMTQPKDSEYFLANLVMMNKMETITSVFRAVKDKVALPIRCYEWELAEPCLSDFTNVLRAPQDTSVGESRMIYYRHGSKPDDFIQAINYAFHMGKAIYGDPVISDMNVLERIRQTATLSTSGLGFGDIVQTF